MTGGEAVAHAMRQIDPDVVPVYPITPQTPIIQGFAKFVADGEAHSEIVNVESEHSAMSAAVGAALAGARTMTATSSQGLALMAEVVYIAAAMRAPIVMAVGNRALSGPINIHCDHSDSMLVRDSGVYFELRRQQTQALESSLDAFADVAAQFGELSGRIYGPLEAYGLEEADRAIVALGSSAGTVKDVVDDLRDNGERVGLLKVVSFRPFPADEVAALLDGVSSVIVLDRADSPGGAAPLHAEVAAALYGSGAELRGHVYGLGGRDLHPEDVEEIFAGRAPHYVGLRGEQCPA